MSLSLGLSGGMVYYGAQCLDALRSVDFKLTVYGMQREWGEAPLIRLALFYKLEITRNSYKCQRFLQLVL